MFCVSRTTIERIVNRETYRHIPARTLPPTHGEMFDFVHDMVGLVKDGSYAREAVTGETTECFATHEEYYGVRRGHWVRKQWSAPTESPAKRLTLAEYEQEARWTRKLIVEIAAERRRELGLELPKKRKKRRTKRQMEWARKHATQAV
jgi:hypothetical protein